MVKPKNAGGRKVRKATKQQQKLIRSVARNPSFNVNQLRFSPASNSLYGHMQQLQAGSAHGMGTQMVGTTGNFYLDNLVDPFRGTCRIPDDYTRPTAVHQSFAHQDITTDDNGEVAILLNPIFGDGATATARNRWLTIIRPNVGGVQTVNFVDDPDYAIFAGVNAIVAGVRPVSAAMLCSFVGDTLSDGGQISAAWIPGDIPVARLNAFLVTGGRAALALEPGSYSGALRDGSYCFWKPDDREDYHLRTLAKTLTHEYPMLVICLKSTKNNTVVARVASVTNFEFSTDTRVVESSSGLVEPDLVLHAKKILAQYPTSCSNDGHVSLWDKIRAGCEQFFATIGRSFRNLFAPSLADINANAEGIKAMGSVLTSMNPGAAAAAAAGQALASA